MNMQGSSRKIGQRQQRLYIALFGVFISIIGLIVYLTREEDVKTAPVQKPQFDVVSQEAKPEEIRLSSLEHLSDVLNERMQLLEKSIVSLEEEKSLIEGEKNVLFEERNELNHKVHTLENELIHKTSSSNFAGSKNSHEGLEEQESALKVWEVEDKAEDKNVLFEIPAGTVVKCVLVSGADCSVAVQKPTGPNMVLLRPLDNGKLPWNVRVRLKGSVIIGNAIGDISTERVYIRTERLTLVERNGSFVETEVSAYVSGEDGREGMRGVVVDKSGQIITRAAFAAFLQGIGQTVQATLNNQTIEKLSQIGDSKTILDLDLLRNSTLSGGSTALTKLSDYYIKRSEQLQPAIQIAAGRVVDVVFLKTIKVGEKDLKKKLEKERELKLRSIRNG